MGALYGLLKGSLQGLRPSALGVLPGFWCLDGTQGLGFRGLGFRGLGV